MPTGFGTPAAELAEGFADLGARILWAVDVRRPLGQRLHDAELIGDLVQEADALADLLLVDLAADGEHGRTQRLRRGERRRGVEETGTRHHAVGLWLAAGQRGAERHVGSRLLVARVYGLQSAGAHEGVEEVVVLHTGQAVDRVHAVGQHGLDDDLGAVELGEIGGGHASSPRDRVRF